MLVRVCDRLPQKYTVEIVIENKPAARDPEGETVMRDLVHKSGYTNVKSIRTGKLLRLNLEASSEAEAKDTVIRMVNELRIYNPVAHVYRVEIKD
ncbi:MAG: phosphoribosylformylglycinamidine synthase subunit PurS [Asgard group archaeon]